MSTAASAPPAAKERPMAMEEVLQVFSRLWVATDALAALGARLAVADDAALTPEIAAALDEVLAAAGVPGLDDLAPPQRAMLASAVRTSFGQAADLLSAPTR